MSHCYACDKLLTDREAARKHKKTKEELGLCDACLSSVEEVEHIPIQDPYDFGTGSDELNYLLNESPAIAEYFGYLGQDKEGE